MKILLSLLNAAALMSTISAAAQSQSPPDLVKRGEYLVTTSGCHDCHTPLVTGPDGPEPDMKRALSGHPENLTIKAPASMSDPWMGAFNSTLTAWSGPWGVSFSANLTPDEQTGRLRDFTEQQFIQTLRTGRHLGQGRQILPPMPWQVIGKMTDDDLRAIFAYLKQVAPVRNKVPDPLSPTR